MLPPSVECLLCHADLVHCLGNRRSWSLQNFNLQKLRYNLCGLFSNLRPSLILRFAGQFIPVGGSLSGGYSRWLLASVGFLVCTFFQYLNEMQKSVTCLNETLSAGPLGCFSRSFDNLSMCHLTSHLTLYDGVGGLTNG